MNDNKVMVIIGANDSDFQAKMGRVDQGVKDASRSIQQSFSGIAIATGISAATVTAFAKTTVDAALAVEKLNLQFKASTGNAQVAAREMAYVRDLSGTLGLSFQSTATGYAKFLAATRDTSIEGAEARRVFEGVSEAATALGLSAEETHGIFSALQQMMSKGKVTAEELNGQLGERLPGAMRLAADAMGLTTGELMKQMEQGKIMAADMLPKLAEKLHETYGSAAQEAATKGQAGINRFKNEVNATAAAIGDNLLPALNKLANWGATGMKTLRENPQGPLDHVFRAIAWAQTGKYTMETTSADYGNYDPQMARVEADRRSKQDQANETRSAVEQKERLASATKKAATEEESLRKEYEQGLSVYARMAGAVAALDPDLSELAKSLAAVDDEVHELSQRYPKLAESFQVLGGEKKRLLEETEARKAANSEIRETILLMEKLNDGWDLAGLGKGLGPDKGFLSYGAPKKIGSLLGGEDFGRPKFDLLGAMPADTPKGLTEKEKLGDGQRTLQFHEEMALLRGDSTEAERLRIQQEEEMWTQSWANLGKTFEEQEERKTAIAEMTALKLRNLERTETQKKLYQAETSFGAMAGLADSFYQLSGKKSKAAFKAYQVTESGRIVASTAAASIDAYRAMVGIPYVGPALAVAAATSAGLYGAAQLKNLWAANADSGATSIGSGGGGGDGGGYSSGGGYNSQIPAQPYAQVQPQGNLTIQITGTVIGEQRWVDENLFPAINDALSRGYNVNVTR